MAHEEVEGTVNPWVMLVVVMAGTFMVVLDNVVINLAIPYIMTAFGTNIEHAKWVSIGFMISATVAMPTSNWLARKFGYTRVYIAALIVFTSGAALCTLSWSMDTLMMGRVVQGLGAGTVQPLGIALLTRNFPPNMRGRAFGYFSTGIMFAPVIGPTMAGLIIEVFNWRAIFTVSVVVGIAVFFLAMSLLDREDETSPIPFDWQGYLSLSTFLVATLLTLSYGQEQGWNSRIILLGWSVALTAFLLFLSLEWEADNPIVPLRLFRIPDFTLAIILTLYKGLARAGAGFLLPIFLKREQGRESLQIGMILVPGPAVNTLFNPVTGFLTDRFGGRWLTVIGTLILVYYLYLYTGIEIHSSILWMLGPQVLRGLGVSLINTPVMTTGLNSLNREEAGNGSWMLNLAMRMGAALSITVISSLLHRQTIIQKDYLGGSSLARDHPPPHLVNQAISIGYSPFAARSAVRAVLGRELGQAASVRAYQNIYFMIGLGVLSSVIPAYFLNRFKAAPRKSARSMAVSRS